MENQNLTTIDYGIVLDNQSRSSINCTTTSMILINGLTYLVTCNKRRVKAGNLRTPKKFVNSNKIDN